MNISITNRYRKLWHACGMLTLVLMVHEAQAVVVCSAVATLPASTYDASAATTTTGSVTVTCTRANSDATDTTVGYVRTGGTGVVTYSIGADGLNTGNTIAVFGTNQLNYSLFRPPTFTSAWSLTAVTAGTVSFAAGQTLATNTTSFTMNVPAARWNSPAGIYTELVTVNLLYGTTTSISNFLNSVTVSSICTFPTAPGDLDFGTYNSLTTGSALAATSAFQMRCTRGVVYSFSFDAATSTIASVNLNYSLTAPAGGTSPNAAVNASIVGSMPAGQSGTCSVASCSGTQARTLMLSY